MIRVAEAAVQVMGTGGKRQVDKVKPRSLRDMVAMPGATPSFSAAIAIIAIRFQHNDTYASGTNQEKTKTTWCGCRICCRWSTSTLWGSMPFAFLRTERYRRLMGVRCPQCKRVYIPPRPVCGICYVPSTEWVEVSDEGTLIGCTVVRLPFIDPMTGRAAPSALWLRDYHLDGASTSMFHFVDETDDAKLNVGMRVKANFREPREGNMRDIVNFRVIGQANEPASRPPSSRRFRFPTTIPQGRRSRNSCAG